MARSHSETEPQADRGGGTRRSNRGWEGLTHRKTDRQTAGGELSCTCSLSKQLSITLLVARPLHTSQKMTSDPSSNLWMHKVPPLPTKSRPLPLDVAEPHLGPSGCVTFREAGFRISLSSDATTSENRGRLARSFCQQSSMSACREAGQSGGGGRR